VSTLEEDLSLEVQSFPLRLIHSKALWNLESLQHFLDSFSYSGQWFIFVIILFFTLCFNFYFWTLQWPLSFVLYHCFSLVDIPSKTDLESKTQPELPQAKPKPITKIGGSIMTRTWKWTILKLHWTYNPNQTRNRFRPKLT